MAQVITSPIEGNQEQASKNWYRSESLRKVRVDLIGIWNGIEDAAVHRDLKSAIEAIDDARCKLDPRLQEERDRKRGKKV